MTAERVYIHYHRPPDRVDVFEQDLVFEDDAVKITLATDIERDAPLVIEDRVVLERGSDVVWFTFPGLWHDIARFHRADGSFTGIYANVLVPCEFEPENVWRTTDLFLDLWIPADEDGARILDEDELAHARTRGWISEALAVRAHEEAQVLARRARQGRWPPPLVETWTLDAARAANATSG